ncbi:hypothetical protein ACIBF1_12050 [Spirillospora sp. NPDC050679]
MALIKAVEIPAHRPGGGVLVVRDAWRATAGPAEPQPKGLAEPPGGAFPWSVAASGPGWARAIAALPAVAVRIEVHDAEPPDDRADWDDVVDVSFRSATAHVALDQTMPLPSVAPGQVVGLGFRRARLRLRARRGPHERWALRFWNAMTSPVPDQPRWLARHSRPPLERLAEDVAHWAAWHPVGPPLMTLIKIADELAADPADLRRAIAVAVGDGRLSVHGDPDDPAGHLMLGPVFPEEAEAPLPDAPPPSFVPPPTAPAPPADWGRTRTLDEVMPPSPHPPRAGHLLGGRLVAPRPNGHGTLTAEGLPWGPAHAWQTSYGVLLSGAEGAQLVRWDGLVQPLFDWPGEHAALDEDGALLACAERPGGGRRAFRLHLIALRDGERRTLPWPEHRFLDVIACHGGAVHFTDDRNGRAPTLRWVPGREPERLKITIREIDPATGTALSLPDDRTAVVTPPGGAPVEIRVNGPVRLAPGGDRVYALDRSRAKLRVHDLDGRSHAYGLPLGVCGDPTWEDPQNVLLRVAGGSLMSVRSCPPYAIRLDLRTGAFERVVPDGQFVKPWIRPGSAGTRK